MMRKRKLTSEERRRLARAFAELRADLGELRSLLEAAAERLREAEAHELRRRARLRRLTFGLLGR
jgi:uncharacterized membrane protein